jgi:hypothetical protein
VCCLGVCVCAGVGIYVALKAAKYALAVAAAAPPQL